MLGSVPLPRRIIFGPAVMCTAVASHWQRVRILVSGTTMVLLTARLQYYVSHEMF